MRRAIVWVLDIIFPPRRDETLVRGAEREQISALLTPRRLSDAPVVIGLLPYRHPLVKACVREAKFHDSEKAARLLGCVLAQYLMDTQPFPTSSTRFLVPVPLSKKRQRERGFNQVERIARASFTYIKEGYGFETKLLGRIRHTKPQTRLNRAARLRNMEGAFALYGTLAPNAAYILIDDVTTTGSTLKSALALLEQDGTSSVAGIALAY